MWLWQQGNTHKTQLLWAKLFLISFSFHVIFLTWLFFLHHDDAVNIAITVQFNKANQQAPVIFVPFKPKKEGGVQNKVLAVPKSAAVIKAEKPKVVMKKREENKIKANKEKTKKLAAQKKISPVQRQTNQETKKKKKKQVNVAKQEKAQPMNNQHKQVQANYREIEAQRRQALLQKELAKCFKPPIGVPPDCICQIKVVVNWDGTVKELVVEQSSGILMYDVAARSAFYTMKIPSWSKGKSITVTFKQ